MANNEVKVTIIGDDKVSPAVGSVVRSIEGMEKTLNSAKAAFEAIGLGKVAAEFIEMGKNAIDAEDRMYKLSQKVGITTESLSGLAHAATLSDVEIDALQKSLVKFNKNIGEAEMGSAKAKDAFHNLGISITDNNGRLKPTEELLSEVADRFQKMRDGVAKTQIAVALFGRAGADMIPMLNNGSAGLRDMADEAQRLGIQLTTSGAQKAEEFNDNLKRLEAQTQGIIREFVDGMIPALNDMAVAFDNVGRQADKGGMGRLGEIAGVVAKRFTALWVESGYAVNELWRQIEILKLKTNDLPFSSDKEKAAILGNIAEIQESLKQLKKDRDSLVYPLAYDKLPPGDKSFSQKLLSTDPNDQADARRLLNQKFPARGGADVDLTSDAQNQKANQLLQARTRLREAAAQRELKIAESARKELISQLELEKEQGLHTLESYFAERRDITLRGYEQEIDALAKKKIALEDQAAKEQMGSVEQLNTLAELARVEGEITTKVEQRKSAELSLSAESIRAERELGNMVLSIEAQIQGAKGHTADVAIAQIHREYEEKRKILALAGKSDAGLSDLENAEVAAAQAEALARKIDAVYAQLDSDVARVQFEIEKRQITELEGEAKINEARAKAREQLGGMVDDYDKLAKASGDPNLVSNAQRIGLEYEKLGRSLNQVRDSVISGVQNSFETLFQSIMTGSVSAAQAFRNFASNILASIAQIIAKMLALWLVQKLVGLFFGGIGSSSIGAGATAGGMGGIGGGGGIGSSVVTFGGAPVGMRAAGGSVAGGSPYLIGEQGPELFIPSQAGVVIPNSQLNGNRGGATIYIDARGADDGVEAKIIAGMRQTYNLAVVSSFTAVNEDKRRR
jgi:hypothetical protein